MHNTSDHSLIHEIEEDLQRQRFEALWKKYGTMILSCALLIVLTTAAITGYRSYRLGQQQKTTAALLEIGENAKKDEKIAQYEKFVKDYDGKSQAVLARFYAASSAMDEGKKDRAIAFYDALAEDKDVEPVFRGLADILSVMAQFDNADPVSLEARLKPLMNGGAWHPLAYELIGHLALRSGDRDKAKKIFTEILNMKDVSPGIQRRAADVFQWLNGGA